MRSPDFESPSGQTSLSAAVESGKERAMLALLQRSRRNINEADRSGRTLLMRAAHGGHASVCSALLALRRDKDAFVNVDAATENGKTALLLAAESGKAQVISVLLQANANVLARATDQSTALHLACQHGHLEAVQRLLDASVGSFSRNLARRVLHMFRSSVLLAPSTGVSSFPPLFLLSALRGE